MPTRILADAYVTGRTYTAGELAYHAVDQADLDETDPIDESGCQVATALCHALTKVLRPDHHMPWASFMYGDNRRYARGKACAVCSWTYALPAGKTEAQLDFATPSAADLEILGRYLPDPRIVSRLCQAVLANAKGQNHEHQAQVLATATEHRPIIAVPEMCAEGECEHEPAESPDPSSYQCARPAAAIYCNACTMWAGRWAGEWAGTAMDECLIPAPCQVLRALCEHYLPKPANAKGRHG